MIDQNAIPIGTKMIVKTPWSTYEGVYFGKEIRNGRWKGYPIIKIESPNVRGVRVSKNGECHGLWIESGWTVTPFVAANISELF